MRGEGGLGMKGGEVVGWGLGVKGGAVVGYPWGEGKGE